MPKRCTYVLMSGIAVVLNHQVLTKPVAIDGRTLLTPPCDRLRSLDEPASDGLRVFLPLI